MADPGVAVLPRGDIADDLDAVFCDENAIGIAGHIIVDVPCLSPAPIVAVDGAKTLFNAVIDRNAGKPFDREALELLKVGRLVEPYSHSLILDFGLATASFWK